MLHILKRVRLINLFPYTAPNYLDLLVSGVSYGVSGGLNTPPSEHERQVPGDAQDLAWYGVAWRECGRSWSVGKQNGRGEGEDGAGQHIG